MKLKLETFETSPSAPAEAHYSKEIAFAREQGYEQGYAAGWQDALTQLRSDDDLRRAAALEALQAISFTYTEAHAALEQSFMALFEALVQVLVPHAIQQAMPRMLQQEVRDLARRAASLPIELHCGPGSIAYLRDVLDDAQGVSITLIEEPAYSDAQLSLRLGTQRRDIDFNKLVNALRDAIDRQSPPLPATEVQYGTA